MFLLINKMCFLCIFCMFFISACSTTSLYKQVRPAYVSSLMFKGYTEQDLLIEQDRLVQYAFNLAQELKGRHVGQVLGTITGVVGSVGSLNGMAREKKSQAVVGGVVSSIGFGVAELHQMDEGQIRQELSKIKGTLDAVASELRKLGVDESLIYSEDRFLKRLEALCSRKTHTS